MEELRSECARTRAAAVDDADARRRAIHARRYLRHYPDADGAANLHSRNNPEVVAVVMAALRPLADRLAAEARARGESEPYEAYLADALAELAAYGAGDPWRRTGGRLRSARHARRRRVPGRGDFQRCRRGGCGPSEPPSHTAHHRTALEWLSPTCAVSGCDELADLECDHNPGWADTHLTLMAWLEMMCGHHHKLKTFRGWSLVAGTGKRAFVPRDDPRHPNNSPPEPA